MLDIEKSKRINKLTEDEKNILKKIKKGFLYDLFLELKDGEFITLLNENEEDMYKMLHFQKRKNRYVIFNNILDALNYIDEQYFFDEDPAYLELFRLYYIEKYTVIDHDKRKKSLDDLEPLLSSLKFLSQDEIEKEGRK